MRHTLVITALLLLFGASTALAVMPPDVYRQAEKNAAFHVQVKVLKVVVPKKTPGECMVTGEVVTIFRDLPKKLKVGRRIAFAVSCRARGDEIPAGGTLWTGRDELLKARYIEAALNSDKAGKKFQVALWNSSIIKAPSRTPQYGFPFHQNKK